MIAFGFMIGATALMVFFIWTHIKSMKHTIDKPSLEKAQSQPDEKNPPQQKESEAPLTHEELRLQMIEQFHIDSQKKRPLRHAFFALAIITAIAAFNYINDIYFALIWSGVAGYGFYSFGIALSTPASPYRCFSRSEYYSLAGSGFSKDTHRCVFCGKSGIWRKGVYASDLTYAHCPKCKEILYFE